ncbi:MAX gene-associated protein isoform X4 [Carettochelys insculpta]|uniref:MAX gene-associated protein isoform X4 n=1 Tax=Carettochelys insculpta TaxID=44489 RepID=UPI003EBE2A2C
MEKQQIVLGNPDSGTMSGAAPAFFVILKQQQGNGKADQGILVANRDACALTSNVSTPVKSKVKTCLPADCTSGSITVTLDNNSMWNEFYHRSTEMILTKQGRRMFPYCRYWITGLDSNLKYILVMDISPVDNHRYKWNGRWWEPSGKAEPHVLGRVFIHPESPSTGQYWMHQPVSFYKLKLTNNTLDQEGHIILHSMHRYLPRLHLVPADKATEVIQLNGPDVHTFTFPQTEFFAVTAYQNIQITQLKIDYNPFAKGFRDDGLNSRPQRDLKQNSSSEHEGGSVSSSPSNRGRSTETDGLDSQQRDLKSSFNGQNPSDIDLEKESFNAERDFLGFLDADLPLNDMPVLKQEISESPITSSYESSSRVASPLDPNEQFNVVIKEEPVDDYDYGSSVCTEGITVKQETTEEETDEYSNSDDDPILEKQLRKHGEVNRRGVGIKSTKRMLANPSGVAKAKMLKLDSGKMPVVYLEPCAVTKSTVKISELPQTMLSSCKKDKSPMSAILESLPVCFEHHNDSFFDTVMEIEEVAVKKQFLGNRMPQKYCSIKEAPWTVSKSSSFKLGSSTGTLYSAKDFAGRKRAAILRNPMSQKCTGTNQNPMSLGPSRRGRPRKLKISKAGRPPKSTGKNIVTSKNASLGAGSILPDVKPDLEDVDGVLFVSFASKEALDIHTVDRVRPEESQNLQTPLLATSDPGCRARICLLEKELLEDLKSLRHKQVIHPSLQEVGLKLNSVDPTMSIDLKYLGVQLPLSYSNSYSFWNYPRVNHGCSDAGFPFVSRTGKTNDFTKIKGWRGKFHGASRNEGSSSEGSLKNRSAFCSDKLDEYLENEGKLMETSMGFSSSTSTSPVVYQLPTKSTSYVRTLDSVLKKQSTFTPSTSYTFKPLSVSSASRKMKAQNKHTASKTRVKSSYKPILPSPAVLKQKHSFSVPGEKVTKSLMANQVDNFMVPALDENMLPKQISLRQAHQQQQTRPPGLSKSQVKLMDLEDCALWDGKPRTYITEERADISLATLLTAQASLKNKPIHKIIRRRAPPCNNDFCRLGCVCASLALEKRQPTHCRRPDCMFGCTCLKRRVLLVKGGAKHKKILKKAVRGSLVFYGPQEEDHQEEDELEEEGDGEEKELKLKDKRRRKKVEYTICDTEPEQPVRNCPLWVKVEGEIDPEPIYIPTPSVIEPVKPLVLSTPEVLPSSKNKSSSGVKPGRVYTPKPNPVVSKERKMLYFQRKRAKPTFVKTKQTSLHLKKLDKSVSEIREEDKDPVYLYFERMMTCARVRAYEPKKEEKKQQKDPFISNLDNCTGKEHDPGHETLNKEHCEMEKDADKSGEKSWWSSRSEEESSSTSYVRHTTPGGPTKLIEIISDCNWEEDRNKILSILSQHINSNMPQSLKVGSFIIELASEHKSRDEKNPPIYSSRVKISMPSCQDKVEKPEMPILETPDSAMSSCNISENLNFLRADALDKLQEKLQGGKGLPFYTGLSPAGKLVAYKRKANLSPSGLIQVNGKSYPQAKLLLGLMGALHPANRLAAYITGRLRPTVLDLSTLSTVISKVASNAKAAASRTPSVQVPTTSTPKTTSSISTTSTPTVTALKAHVPAQRQIEDGSSQTTTASPQGLSSGTEKRVGPRLLLIPMHQGSPALRPLHNVQLAQGHRMILQPLRSPAGVNLFRHPNGQIIQLVPLHQLRAAGTQSNIQPIMFRNPGSVVGIRLPGPSKPHEIPISPKTSSSVTSVSPAKNPAVQTVGSRSAPTANLATQASSILPSVPSFVSQAGTLTLRISPPGPSGITGQTGSESKITYSSGGQPPNATSLVPLQSGSFALLQLPGPKSVPNSILHHVASLQMKKDSQDVNQKDESSPIKQQEQEKASHSEDVEVMESEVTVSDSKQEENELPANESSSNVVSAADAVISGRNSTASEMAEKDSEVLEDYSDDIPIFQHDVSADVISSDHSYISEKPFSEKNKVISEKKEDAVHSEQVLEEISGNSGAVSELQGPAIVAPGNTASPESLREEEETALLKSHMEEYISTVQAESADTEQERNVQLQEKGKEKVNASQSQNPQNKESFAQQERTQQLENQKELQDSIAQLEIKKKECDNSMEAEDKLEEEENKSEMIYNKVHGNNSGKIHMESIDECKKNLGIQKKLKTPNQEQGTTGFQKASEKAKNIAIHVNNSWNTISSKTTGLDNESNTENGNRVEKSVKGHLLTPEQRAKEPKHHKKGYTSIVDMAIGDVEEEEEDDDEKTDDSGDEMLDGASDFQSEEEVDVEKLNDCEYSENDETVDIETVEELSEKINIARLKATASHIRSSKQKHRIHNPSDEKGADKSTKKAQFWNRKKKSEAEAFAHYRQTHTANERRRRNEMRDLFEKLKRALGLHSLPKVSKCYILKQAYEEIQGLTDQADKLIGQKNLLTRKQDVLIRKVSTLSGKTEEVVLKKLEYIYAKQKAVEAQKKRKQVEPEGTVVCMKPNRQSQEGSSTSSKELEQMIVTNKRGKPLILARKGGQAAVETTTSPITLTTASLVMTPQGQVLTLKSPLMSGQVATVPSTLLQAELKNQFASNTVETQPGIASVMIQLPGSTVPVQVKGILANSAIPITLSTIASNPVPPAVGQAAEPASENEDSFVMPKIVNVTSLAAEGGVNLNLNRNKNSHVIPGAGAQTTEPSMKAGSHESRQDEDTISEEKNKASPGDSCGDARNVIGPLQIFLENKNSFPQIRNVSSIKDSSESFAKKPCTGEFVGNQGRRKELDQGGERVKPKDFPIRKLQVKDLKDSRIEMELRKVASAIEEAELDQSELLSSIEESDDTDETLTSLLNEIAFLNQQLNEDASGMSELPGTLSSDFSQEDSETRRGTAGDLPVTAGSSFPFGHLGSSFKALSEVREGSGSISPLLLHLEDDDLTGGERNSAEPSSQADILKIVIGSEMKDPLANVSVTGGGSGKILDTLAETSVSPPILQMKTSLEAGNTDTLWRPMPKLAPLGLKIANLPLDSEGQSAKVMPVLAPVVAKLAPIGLKTKLPATDKEGQESKMMPTLASVVAKLNSIGTLPSNSAAK